ncbi:MAG: hypothetical protein WAZ50_00215 [Minisyncoccia bacterium]
MIEANPVKDDRYELLMAFISILRQTIEAVENNTPHHMYNNPLQMIPRLIEVVERYYTSATANVA